MESAVDGTRPKDGKETGSAGAGLNATKSVAGTTATATAAVAAAPKVAKKRKRKRDAQRARRVVPAMMQFIQQRQKEAQLVDPNVEVRRRGERRYEDRMGGHKRNGWRKTRMGESG